MRYDYRIPLWPVWVRVHDKVLSVSARGAEACRYHLMVPAPLLLLPPCCHSHLILQRLLLLPRLLLLLLLPRSPIPSLVLLLAARMRASRWGGWGGHEGHGHTAAGAAGWGGEGWSMRVRTASLPPIRHPPSAPLPPCTHTHHHHPRFCPPTHTPPPSALCLPPPPPQARLVSG